MRVVKAAILCAAGLASTSACSSEPTGNPNIVRFVAIQGSDTIDVGAFGTLQLTAFGLNADRVEVDPAGFSFSWRSLEPSVATVISGGIVTVFTNGTARIVAQVGEAADTITLQVQQVATRITFSQDTAVALMAGATRLSGDVLPNDTMFIVAHRADANGNPMSVGGAFTWSTGSALLTVLPVAGTDSAKIIGSAPGSGTLSASIAGVAAASLQFQVVDQYAVVRMLKPATPTGVTGLTPSTVTVPAGAAVVFRSADQDLHAAVSSTDQWRTSALKGPNGREAQRFGVAGDYTYKVENTTGTVVVQ
jgi:plastocyanin